MASQSESILKSFVTDGSERSVQDIVSKLKFISKIKEGDIVNVSNLTLSEKGLGTSVYRTYLTYIVRNDESRDETLKFFRQVTGEAFDMADRYLPSNEPFFREIGTVIINALQESKTGIADHAITYKTDRMYVSKIETLLTTIDTKITDLQRRITAMRKDCSPASQGSPVEKSVSPASQFPPAPQAWPAQIEQTEPSPPHSIPDPETMMKQRRRGRRTTDKTDEAE